MAATRAVMLVLSIFITFCIKKPFVDCDSVCYDYFHGNVKESGVTYVYETLFLMQNGKEICLKPKLALYLLLLIAGDVETCPGPRSKTASLTGKEFKEKLAGKGLKMGHQNIRGLGAHTDPEDPDSPRKFDSFQSFVELNRELDIIGLSETHLNDRENMNQFEIEGYKFFPRNRKNKGGGVAIYIKNNISYKERKDLHSPSIENIYIEIFVKNSKSFIVGFFYRPPDDSKYLCDNFNDRLNDNIEIVSKENKEIILMGDFNVNYENDNDSRSHFDFKNIMSFHGFKQIISTPTRITEDTATLIDHIFVTNPASFPISCVVATSLSDHDFVYCCRKINSFKYSYRTIKCRDYRTYNSANLRNDVKSIDWLPVYNNVSDPNKAADYLSTELKNTFDRHAPLVDKRVKGKPWEWLNDNIKSEMNIRDKLERKARGSKSKAHWAEYKRQKNRCINLIRRAKSAHYRNALNQHDRVSPKKFWKTIKSIFPTKSKHSASSGTIPTADRVKNFSNYFSTIVKKMKSINFPLRNCTWSYCRKRPLRTKSIFKFSYITPGYVLKHLNKLKRNKATGIDSLPPNMLKDCAEEIAEPLSHIINLSLMTSTVPTIWKTAKVNPVFKSGNVDLVENFRPISILPILSKLLERTVHDQLYSFLEDNKLLSECQFGFRKRRSTKLAATLLCDSVRRGFENGLLVGCLFLDLSKAFDTMGHSLIIEKLLLHGVSGPELAWITDYLFNRTQIVEINNIFSTKEAITSGVPQGSILGPLLFIVFFNDLCDFINHSSVIQYADDTVIYFGAKTTSEIETALNGDLSEIVKYCEENELLLNFKKGKTEVMLFGTAQRMARYGDTVTIKHNNTIVNSVTQYCYLGNTLDHHLNLSKNFDHYYKIASGRLRLLFSVRKFLTLNAAKSIYDLMIAPLLTYSCSIKTTFNEGQKSKLASLERRAAMIIGVPSIKKTESLIEKEICNMVKNCVKKVYRHQIFDNYFKVIEHKRGTRNNKKLLKLPKIKLEASRPSFYFGAAIIVNNLDISNREFLGSN